MTKLVGLITAWGAEPFIEPAIKHGLEYCDELVVSVGLHMPHLKRFEDRTMDICNKYKNQIKIVPSVLSGAYVNSRGASLKKMLDDTGNNKKGNWTFVLDADEFYFPEDIEICKQIIKEDKFKMISAPEKVFMVDTKHYIKWNRTRFKKLVKDNTSFRNNIIGYENQTKPFKLDTDKGMFHYTFLMNPYAKEVFWKNEYGNPNSKEVKDKIYWLNEIYMKMDLANQQPSVKKSINRFGIKSVMGIIFNGGGTKPNGELHEYNGEHSSFIEDAGITKINDFRKYYKK